MNINQEVIKRVREVPFSKNDEVKIKCPCCAREKMYVNLKKQVYHCFRCGKKGVVQGLVKSSVKITQEFLIEEREKVLSVVIPEYKMFTEESLTKPFWDFLMKKGMGKDWERVGFLGWGTSTSSYLQGRLIIPIFEKEVVSYVARSVDGREPKEISGPNRSQYLYNLDSVEAGDTVFITEGIFDCEAVIRAGFKAIALMGSKLSQIALGKLLQKAPKEVKLLLDNDSAGYEGALSIMKMINSRSHIGVHLLDVLPPDVDPDELDTENLRELIT